MKKRIICVVLSLVAVFSLLGFHATETWFGSGENKSMQLSSGDLDFTAVGDLSLSEDEKDLILPGAELTLKEAIVITNLSTIDTELRVRVECTYDGSTEVFKWIEFLNDGESKWLVNPDDGCIYYTPKVVQGDDKRIPAVDIEVTETTTDGGAVVDGEVTETTTRVYADNEIPLAGTIKISGDVPVELQGKELKIEFFIEAKQADFLDWKTFGEIKESAAEVPSEETSE